MSIAERISSSKRPFRIPASSENVLLAIVAFAFLSLHVAAGTLLHAALPDQPIDQSKEAIVSYGD